MDFDLRRELNDLGRQAGARADDLPVGALLRRAHRRRAAVTTAYGAVGAGTATALAFGGVALLDRPDDPPVAVEPSPTPSPTASPTPTPTPTPTPSTSPTPTFQPSWDLCGADLQTLWPQGSTDDTVWSRASGSGPEGIITAEIGGRVVADIELWTVIDGTDELTATLGRTVVTAWDEARQRDVVVAVSTTPAGLSAHGTLSATETVAVGHLDVGVATCDSSPAVGDDGAGTLPEGMYSLISETSLARADGTTVTTLTTGTLAVGDPDELDMYETGEELPNPVTGDPSTLPPALAWTGLPACGGEVTAVPPATWWTTDAVATAVDGRVDVTVTARHTGLDIADGAALGPLVTITRDGMVVAQSEQGYEQPWVVRDWVAGSAVTRTTSVPAVACADIPGATAGGALPAGTYQVWTTEQVAVSTSASSGWAVQYSGPWTLTIP